MMMMTVRLKQCFFGFFFDRKMQRITSIFWRRRRRPLYDSSNSSLLYNTFLSVNHYFNWITEFHHITRTNIGMRMHKSKEFQSISIDEMFWSDCRIMELNYDFVQFNNKQTKTVEKLLKSKIYFHLNSIHVFSISNHTNTIRLKCKCFFPVSFCIIEKMLLLFAGRKFRISLQCKNVMFFRSFFLLTIFLFSTIVNEMHLMMAIVRGRDFLFCFCSMIFFSSKKKLNFKFVNLVFEFLSNMMAILTP